MVFMSEETRKYKFSWESTIGCDMDNARPSLGPTTRVEVYRLFQFCLRDILEQNYGTEKADELFRDAGVLAGKNFYDQFLSSATDANSLVNLVRDTFSALGIGIFRVEAVDADGIDFRFTVDEDLDCSGMPDTSDVVCVYDEGFIQGILEKFTGKKFQVREVDCWCTGSRTCRFDAVSL